MKNVKRRVDIIGYVGCYADDQTKLLYQFGLDANTGQFKGAKAVAEAADVKYLSIWDNCLAYPLQAGDKAGVRLVDADTLVLKAEAYYELVAAAYILQDGQYIYTGNFHEGSVLIYDDKLNLIKRIETGKDSGVHQLSRHSNYLLVNCMNLDKIFIYDLTSNFELVKTIDFKPGVGIRHGVFNKQHDLYYLVSEYTNEVFVFKVDGLQFNLINQWPLLSRRAQNPAAAAIRLSQDETRLFVSIRGADLINVYEVDKTVLTLIQQVSCGGQHPRDFIFCDDEQYLIVANRLSDELVSFRLGSDKKIKEKCGVLKIKQPIAIIIQKEEKYNE